jgi:hypothetical protein
VLEQAIHRAVLNAQSLGGLPAAGEW